MDNEEIGYEEGDVCNRQKCSGVIQIHPVDGCTCHLHPPCASCTSPRAFCNACGWEQSEDVAINDYVAQVNKKTGYLEQWSLRPLDSTKIDWHSKTHTHFSMIKEGVYPEGTTKEQVEELVRGTFGGRFERFDEGRFRYVAYTD